MKTIALSGKLGKGKSVKVDDDDYEKYNHLVWHLSDTGYAVRRSGKTVRLHRLIMDCPEGMVVDHLNGDTLDNRKCNLRICTQAENIKNHHNTKGYCYDKSRKKWMARYRKKFYGRYETKEEAKRAYKLACSGIEYKTARRKYYMLPKHISRQFGKYVVSIQVKGKRYRKVAINTLKEALSWRDNIYKTLEKED
jgi:pathogenesis-related transcriptional factor and ERF protein